MGRTTWDLEQFYDRNQDTKNYYDHRRGEDKRSELEVRLFVTTLFKHCVQRFCREVILWNSLSHPNILKLTGVLGSIDTFNFSTVSEWMTHDTIMKYTKTADANRLQLVRTIQDFSPYLVLNSVDLVARSSSRPEVYARC